MKDQNDTCRAVLLFVTQGYSYFWNCISRVYNFVAQGCDPHRIAEGTSANLLGYFSLVLYGLVIPWNFLQPNHLKFNIQFECQEY